MAASCRRPAGAGRRDLDARALRARRCPIAEAGLKAPQRRAPAPGGLIPRYETHFLNALDDSVESGRVPADELLAQSTTATGAADLTRIYGEYCY